MSDHNSSLTDADPIDPAPTSNPTTPDVNAAPSATPQGNAAPAPRQPASEGMVPSYRIRETREAAIRESQQQWATREAEYQARLEGVQRQLHALVGVTPQGDPEVTAIKQQFEKLFPGLSRLEQRAQDLEGLVERSGDLDSQNQHYWTSYGRQNMDRLYSLASESLGAPLTDEGKRALHAAFSGYVSSSPELTSRYTQDPGMVAEFWQNFATSFIDPVRRTATATMATHTMNRQLPLDSPSGMPQVQAPPRAGSLDERVQGAWAAYNAAATRPRP